MGVTEGEPEIFVPRCRADDREHIRGAGARSHPWGCINASGQREKAPRQRLETFQLDGCWRGIAMGEFRTGCQTDAVRHGSEDVAIIRVIDGVVENGVALGVVVHVIATFDAHGERIAQRMCEFLRPRAEANHDVPGGDGSGLRVYRPSGLAVGQ